MAARVNCPGAEALPLDARAQLLAATVRAPSLFSINLLSEYLALDPALVWDDPALERVRS